AHPGNQILGAAHTCKTRFRVRMTPGHRGRGAEHTRKNKFRVWLTPRRGLYFPLTPPPASGTLSVEVSQMSKRALIVGTSQAEASAAGGVLEKLLKLQGYEVSRHAKHGANIRQTADLVRSLPQQAYDIAIVFQWDADANMQHVQAIVDGIDAPLVYWYGASPATRITNMASAKAAFPKVDSADYWFSPASGPYAQVREDKNAKLKGYFAKSKKVRYVDWRDLQWVNDEVQPNGVSFPNLPDGIHVTGSIAKEAFAPKIWPPPASSVLFAGLPGGISWSTAILSTLLGVGVVLAVRKWLGFDKTPGSRTR
ncbi:MAG: hypothetical protein Q7R45_11615, partial [Sulfuricaulis sp.]|nr:hypothetical protein [Sulfuricaulis sp.]